MLAEAFKGKSCSNFSAAVGAFAVCSPMQERSTTGQWAPEEPAQCLIPPMAILPREMAVGRGLGDRRASLHFFLRLIR